MAKKTEFCEMAIEEMNVFGDLSPEAEDIAKRLYTFINEHNS